jgi:L,D-transpeptidase ErfK/SrfK
MLSRAACAVLALLAATQSEHREWRIEGERIVVLDSRHVVPRALPSGIVINVPQRMLFLMADGRPVAAYRVAAGRPDWPTPLGTFGIAEKEIDPTWDVPLSIQREMRQQGKKVMTRIGPGPSNPLGDRYLRVSGGGIGIHGTNAPSSIGRLTTHGCIRLHPQDIRALFDRVEVGTPVQIIYEPVLVAQSVDGRVWLEVHPDAYRRTGDVLRRALTLVDSELPLARLDADRLRECVARRAGRACEISETPSTASMRDNPPGRRKLHGRSPTPGDGAHDTGPRPHERLGLFSAL